MAMDRRKFISTAGAGMASMNLALGNPSDIQPAIIKPKRLRKGDTVALVNPASATALRDSVQIVKESMEALGLNVRMGKNVLGRRGYFAGTDEERAADLNHHFADPEIKGIIAVRGGWGCARLLPLIDFELIRKNPKVLVGYSDVTALLLAIYAKTGLVTFHGPVGMGPWNNFSTDYFRKILFQKQAPVLKNPDNKGNNLTQVRDRVVTITPGRATGRLLGGNLTVLSAIIGSGYLPDWKDSIIFLEDVGEYIYRIDRMLTQLKLAGILDSARGFIFGKCTDCGPGEGYGSLTLEELFDDHIKPLKIPAWQGAMIGHEADKFTVPLGIEAAIDSVKGTINLLEPAVE